MPKILSRLFLIRNIADHIFQHALLQLAGALGIGDDVPGHLIFQPIGDSAEQLAYIIFVNDRGILVV